jgi:DNA-binding GntR family transcriptional regulator
MREPAVPERRNDGHELEKVPVLIVKKIRDAILDETFQPGERLPEAELAKNSAREHFDYNRQFWDIIFEKTQRPVLWEVFRQLDDRSTRYNPLLLRLFPDPASRPRQREILIELYRKGKVNEALRAFKKIYFEVVYEVIDCLRARDSAGHATPPNHRP